MKIDMRLWRGIRIEIDVTDFLYRVKKEEISFTIAMVYAVCKCANEIEAFRYRFLDGKVVLFGLLNDCSNI